MRRFGLVGSVVALLIGCTSQFALGQDSFAVVNDTGWALELWIYRESAAKWKKPPLFLARKDKKSVRIETPGRYYLVAREADQRRDFVIGWYDVHSLVRSNPNIQLNLSIA